MVVGELRLIRVDMSESYNPLHNNYILGRIVEHVIDSIQCEEMIYLRILGSSKCPERYSIKLLATDREWEQMAETLKGSISTKLAKIKFYNVKSGTEKEGEES